LLNVCIDSIAILYLSDDVTGTGR